MEGAVRDNEMLAGTHQPESLPYLVFPRLIIPISIYIIYCYYIYDYIRYIENLHVRVYYAISI